MIADTTQKKRAEYFLEQVQASIPVPVIWEGGKHVASRLLTPEENSQAFGIIGNRKKVLATTVAQIWLAYPKDTGTWNSKLVGVLCFVKDFTLKSHFMRLLNISNGKMDVGIIWEQEIYKQFQYKAVSACFHTFEGNDCNVGLNFCDSEEADYFHKCIKERIAFFRKKRAALKEKRKKRRKQHVINDPVLSDVTENLQTKHCAKSGPLDLDSRFECANVDRSQRCVANDDMTLATVSLKKESAEMKGDVFLINFSSSEEQNEKNAVAEEALGSSNVTENCKRRQFYIGQESITSDGSKKLSVIERPRCNLSSIPQSLSLRGQRNQNRRVLKIAEKQKEYHSSMIRYLVLSRDAKERQGELLKQSAGGLNDIDSKQEPPKTPERKVQQRDANEKPRKESTGELKRRIEKSETELHCPKLNPVGSIINGSLIFCNSEVSGNSKSPQINTETASTTNARLKSQSRSLRRFATQSNLKIQKGKMSDALFRSSTSVSSRRSLLSDGSKFSFPSLPSLDKLQLSTSVQMTGLAYLPSSNQASKTTVSADDRHKEHQELERRASNEQVTSYNQLSEPMLSSSTANCANDVLDLRAELMKSIIAGKKLKKVQSRTSNMRRQTVIEKHFEDMTETLSNALNERNKFLQESSDEGDNYDDDEWTDDETED